MMLGIEFGWIFSCSGRQPWTIYGMQRTVDASTRADFVGPLFILFIILYIGLGILTVFVLRTFFRNIRLQMIYITKEAILVHEESIAIIILWALIFVYSILGSIDFGAGFWGMVYAKHPTLAAKLANRYLSPTWEVTNTFLVFVVVAFLGFFRKQPLLLRQ